MANQDRARGLQLRSCNPELIQPAYVPATDSTALGVGDPVIRTANGSNSSVVKSGITSFEPGTLPEVTRATAGDSNLISGVVVDVEADPTSRTEKTRPASTEGVVWVCFDPDAIYEAQCNGSLTATQVGLNAVLASGTINSTTGESGFEVDTTTDVPAADASNQVRILGVTADPLNNDLSSANPNVLVTINTSTEASDYAGTLGV